jgi:hypothetical protein
VQVAQRVKLDIWCGGPRTIVGETKKVDVQGWGLFVRVGLGAKAASTCLFGVKKKGCMGEN